jgi:hypothetical protein
MLRTLRVKPYVGSDDYLAGHPLVEKEQLDSPGSCARLIPESILLRRQFTPGIYEFLAATIRHIVGGNPKGESVAMIRGPRQIAPREELANSGESRQKEMLSGSALDRKSRAHAPISIDSLTSPKIWRLKCGANRI